MPTVEEITDPLLRIYATVLPVGAGVCDICHGAPNPGYATCWSCAQTTSQVRRPVRLVVPISLYQHSSQLHHVLWAYKNSPPSRIRDRFQLELAAMFGRFLYNHQDCIRQVAGASWDALTTVPSSRDRPGGHPLDATLSILRGWDEVIELTLRRGSGEITHLRAADAGYVPLSNVAGRSFLLVDDTFTSGARLQSAASALGLAGARVVAAVALGRIIDPRFSDATQLLWQRATGTVFTFEKCCLCA